MKDELLGKQLASYQLVQLLGQGAFGSVYLGKHFLLTQKPPVAIKILNTALNSQEEVDRFFQEAVLLDTLSHPHILPIIDANLYEGYPYFIAEYAQGGSLQDRLEQLNGEPMPLDEALHVLQQTGDGLQHAHDLDVVHRDLKPANILFDAYGEAMLADFGIALQVQRTRRVDEIGTPAYMSPEQFKGKISKKSDQYALACIAYELVTGQQLFIADDPYTIGYKHIYEAPAEPHTLNPGVPPQIEEVILKALAKEHNDRYDSVADFIQALLDAATQENSNQAVHLIRRSIHVGQASKSYRRKPKKPHLLNLMQETRSSLPATSAVATQVPAPKRPGMSQGQQCATRAHSVNKRREMSP